MIKAEVVWALSLPTHPGALRMEASAGPGGHFQSFCGTLDARTDTCSAPWHGRSRGYVLGSLGLLLAPACSGAAAGYSGLCHFMPLCSQLGFRF